MKQSIIMPYHRNKSMLQYTTRQLEKIIDNDVEIIVVGNNSNRDELDVSLSSRIKYIKIFESLLYSQTVNYGVEIATGDIITLCDQDIFSYSNWYIPLLEKLQSDKSIGSVSSKLLNPSNNRIIDFGIEYSLQRTVHPLRGHMYNHPLTLNDRKVTSTTSATLMTYKSLYQKVGGMDLDMPYCCSDADIGIKISQEGYDNWVVADSIAFHKGSSSTNNGKMQSFNHLRGDSTTMFWVKNKAKLSPTIESDIKRSVDYIASNIKPIYTFINLSSLSEYKWYSEMFSKLSNSDISDVHSYKVSQNYYHETIQLYDYIPYYFINYSTPIIYFVDYFPSLKDNLIWSKMRNIENDLVYDCAGNVISLNELINGHC